MAVQKRGAKDGGTSWIAFAKRCCRSQRRAGRRLIRRLTPPPSLRGAQQRGSPEAWGQGWWYFLDCSLAFAKMVLPLAKTSGPRLIRRLTPPPSLRGAQQRGSPEAWGQGWWYFLDCFASVRKDGAAARKDERAPPNPSPHSTPVTARRAATWQSRSVGPRMVVLPGLLR